MTATRSENCESRAMVAPAWPGSASAAVWDEVAVEYARRIEPFTASFVPALFRCAGEIREASLLDVACGTGAVAISASSLGARVVATDASPAMLSQLSARSMPLASNPVETRLADGEALPAEWICRFDIAVSHFGIIFFSDPAVGIREMTRVVRPGGLVLITAWGVARETPAFQVIPDAVRHSLPVEMQPLPTQKRIDGSPDGLRGLLLSAGLVDVGVHGPETQTLTVESAESFWDRFALGAPGTRELLASLPQEAAMRLKQAVLNRLRADFGDGPVKLPASAYIAFGRKHEATRTSQ